MVLVRDACGPTADAKSGVDKGERGNVVGDESAIMVGGGHGRGKRLRPIGADHRPQQS